MGPGLPGQAEHRRRHGLRAHLVETGTAATSTFSARMGQMTEATSYWMMTLGSISRPSFVSFTLVRNGDDIDYAKIYICKG